ncbi:MAG: CerR family C-terminal domain-containing protein [Planctomycetota bacterium]|nr:CerR family C-terminal domain-containing protein [Planctomycetota bacterium]
MSETSGQTRSALLKSSITLFSQRGYADVGIREIADAAGANIASIKYHFGSKKDLYLAAVAEVMGRNNSENAWKDLSEVPDDPRLAAQELIQFLRHSLKHLIPPGSSVESCSSLMIREALHPSEAFDSIVENLLIPNNEGLINLLGKLVPDADRPHLNNLAGSVMGQIMHIRIFRPFVERLRGVDLSNPDQLDQMAMHIAQFTLRGLGLKEIFIFEAIQSARETEAQFVQENKS